MTKPAHSTLVKLSVQPFGYRGKCQCGWLGAIRNDYPLADADNLAHTTSNSRGQKWTR